MSDNTELLIEANKRGLLTGEYQSLYDDAVKNGIIKVEKPENEQGLFLDSVDSFQAGALSGMGGMFDFVGAEGMAKSLYDWSDDQQKTMSESGKKALSKQFVVEDENGDIALGEGAKDLDTWILTMANVAGQFAGTAVPGGAAARAVTKVASLGARGSKAATVAGMGATGGSAATGQGMEQARKEVESMPDDILGDSPMFIKTLREIHSSNPELSGAEKWDLAKKEISERVAQDVRTDPKVLIANFGASAIGDPIIGKALVGARLAKSGALKSSLAGFATEGATEAVQAGTQQYGINEALQPLDNRDAMDGVVTAGLNEGLAGAGFGGIAGGIGGVVNRGNAKPEDQPSSILPDDETTPRIDENKSVQLPETVIDEIAAPARSEAASKFQSASSDIVSNGVDQLVGTGFTKEQAIEAVKAYQYQAAIKKGLSEREASLVVAQTMKDKFDIDDPILAMPEPAQEQTIPDDNVTPQLEDNTTSEVDYDAPTASRQAGFDQTAKAAGQYGDMLTSPAQQSLRDLEAGNNAPTVDERVKAAAFDKSPTPEDRFSPIKYTYNGELLSGDDQASANPDRPALDTAVIDGQTVPEQGKLPSREQPIGIEQKDIIFAGNDGRADESNEVYLNEEIESGVTVDINGKPFKTRRDALLSNEARAARRAGQKTKAVRLSNGNGYGWTIKGDDGAKQDSEQAAAEQSPETDTVAQNEQDEQAQPDPQGGEALSLNVDASRPDEEDKKIAVNDKVNGVQVIDTPVSELSLSKDIPQFKSGSNTDGVVEPLTGKFDPVGMSPVQVWVRNNGNKEIITGRHRFDLAKRDGVENIPAQYHYESDGFTADDGKRLDAILNIREDKGQVEDYVELFKQDGITESEAKQYGLLDRATGRTAFKIANSATNETIEAQRTGRISAQAAEAIADAAPGNERLQVLGIKSIADDQRSITFAKNLIHAVSALDANQDQGGQSGDLFGFDDSAMQEAEQMAKVAATKQREIRNRLSAIRGAANKPEIAAAEGVNVKDPKALKERTNELANEVKAWDSWHTNPSMVQQIRDSISAPNTETSAPNTAPITETAAEPESTEQDNGPDMFGDSEPPLFNQDPTAQSNKPEIPDSSTAQNANISKFGVDVSVPVIDSDTERQYNMATHRGRGRDFNEELRTSAESILTHLNDKGLLDTPERKSKAKEVIESYLEDSKSYIYRESNRAANNPSWAITGRDNLDLDKYNSKAQSQARAAAKEVDSLESKRKNIAVKVKAVMNDEQRAAAQQKAESSEKQKAIIDFANELGAMQTPGLNKSAFMPRAKKAWDRIVSSHGDDLPTAMQKIESALAKNNATLKGVLGSRSKLWKEIDAKLNDEQQSNTSQAPVKQAPIESGLDAYDAMAKSISDGELNSAEQIKNVLNYLADNQDSVKAELNKLNKKQLTRMVNGHVWSDTKKAELVNSAYRDMFSRFMFIGNQSSFVSSSSYKLEDKISDAKKHVESLTDQQVAEYSQEQKAKVDEQKARFDQYLDKIKNPQTLDDYKAKIKAQGQDSLTTEQQAEYDKLIAQETIQTKNERPAEKQGLNSDGDVELGEPVEGVHGKTGEKIFNVNVISRLGKDAFKEAAAFARSMGGGYYRGNFYFKSVEDAELFSAWVNGETVDTTEMQAKKSEQRNAKNKDKLQALADRAQEQANEALNADRKTNTVKRLNESQAATERAEKELALAKVMKEIPDSETIVIKGATQKVQVELLDQLSRSLVHSAPDSQVDKDSNSKRTFKESISNAEKAKHARMPLKTVRVFRLNELANDMLETKGFVLLGRKLKSITKGKADQDYVDIFDSVIPKYIDYINKHTSQYDMLRDEVANYKRLERMGVSNEPTLRTALIEYMDLRDQSVKATPKSKLSKMEQELQRTVLGNRKAFNDFFPTPETIAADIADMADIEQGMRVLEPSAGNGLLADAAREQGANVDVVEMAGQLREILQEKGYNLVGSDFLDVDASQDYDRIIMNPPFSNDQDIKHVEHAYKMLKPGGKLIAITSSGAGERSNKTNKEFKDWLDALDAEQQPLPEGAFKSSLNPTGVNTKVIVIEKPAEAASKNQSPATSISNEIEQLGNELKASLSSYAKRSALEKRLLKLVDDVKEASGNWYLVQKKLFDGEYESDIDAGIAEAIDSLANTAAPEKTSEGIKLFSKSKAKKNAKGVNAKQAQTIADDFIESLNGANGIKVRILATTAEAEKMWRMSLDGATVKGAYSEMSNTVYVIAENIDNVTDLKQTLAHETIAHGGLDTVIGKDAKQAFIDRIKKTKGRKAFEKYWKDANNDYWDASEDVKAEEIFARFVENEPSRGEVKYWWNALKRFVRAQLDKLGVVYREDDELTAMRDMLESIVKGFKAQREPVATSKTEMAYSQSDKKFSRTAKNDTNPAPNKIGDSVKKAFNRDRFEKSSVPEWEALNAQLRETDKTAGDKIKRQLSRWFMPGGNLPETVQQAKRGRDRDVAVHEFDVSMLVGKLNSAMKAAKINPDRLADDQWTKYHQFLIGENDGKALNQSERDVLLAMRGHIDGLTRDYVASVNNKLQQRLESEGIEDPKEIARLEKMLGNIGKYLNRSYKAFDDQKWFAKIPTNVIDDARAYLIRQHVDNGIDQGEAVRKAQVTLNEIVKTGTAYDSLGAFISESKLGAKDLSSLIKRKNIAPEIRALLGEYSDPRINYAKSVSKMSAMIANDKLLNTIRDMGINNFIFEKDDRPANATVQLAGEGSEVYAPLNGMWTTPEIKEAFEDAMGGERGEGWLDKVIQINGFIKFGKTVLSPTTAMRNVMSSYFFTVANGHFNQKYMKQAISAFNAQVKGKVTNGESDYMKRLIKLGVLYDSANAGEMVKMMTDGKVSQMLEGKSGAAFESLRWLTEKATGFYRFGDDFWKIVGFENEKAALLRAGMAEGEAEVLAAERIQDTYPTYSRVGKAGVWLSRFPLAGTFVSFPAEIIRTTGNMMKLAASELKSSDPAIRAMGSRRVVGISLASGGMFALGALTKAMFGVTDDEEEALRDLAPPWQKNSTFLYAGRDKDGNLRYFDMTFMDPYAYWKRPIEAMMRDQPVNEAISSSLSDMVSPFLGTDISAGKVLEVVSNQKESGGQVYKENDTAIRKGADIASHLALGLAPGAVNNAWRIGMAATDVKRSTGKPYSLSDEMLALAGFRSSTFDPKVGLYYRTFDFNSAIAEARKELSGVLRDPNKVSDDEISAAKERAKTKQEQAFKQMSRLIKAAQTGGASRRQVMQILLLAGISKRNVGFLLREQVPPVNLSDRSFESAVKRAQLIMDNESAREVRSRFNRIIKND